MTYFFATLTVAEQTIITNAYEWEMEAIRKGSYESNPYFKQVKALGLWEALNEAVEIAFN